MVYFPRNEPNSGLVGELASGRLGTVPQRYGTPKAVEQTDVQRGGIRLKNKSQFPNIYSPNVWFNPHCMEINDMQVTCGNSKLRNFFGKQSRQNKKIKTPGLLQKSRQTKTSLRRVAAIKTTILRDAKIHRRFFPLRTKAESQPTGGRN
jgi:hypothetical protein